METAAKKKWAAPAFLQKLKRVNGLGALFPLAVICIFLCLFTGSFAQSNNIMQVLRQAAVYAIMGIGMTFVIITGGIDLSQGSVLAFCCVLAGMTINATGNMWLGMAVSLLAGALAGLINGVVIAYVRIPAFIMTLGTMFIFRGVTLWMTNSTQIAVNHQTFKFIGQGFFLGIPVPVYVFLAAGWLAHIVLTKTATGRYIFSIGSNAETARLSGVRIERNTIKVYILSGMAIGLAAIVYLARLTAAQPTAGQSYEMEAVAAVVIGGTSISGGEGGILGTLIGAVTVAVIRNGLVLLGVQSYFTQIVVGAIIVFAVALDITRKRIAASK
ncbi:ABC transporter permease [Agathobaculum sp. NTUH-O15-33]|uniref:ABC transporter permease n=1 Tax=Agathobaculum sp. NTUH-O15-33 TaxID=3079302 RepID=UPI002958CD26|nr:ABC transporter permease [Agathobaculum sp. NTUH-O15-33]WNX85598.1 ABC transporter permease [Agathobaculum sp. NTUH-O15-33]